MSTLDRLARLAALPLAASLLVACGGGSGNDSGDSSGESADAGSSSSATETYCASLEEAQQSFQAFDSASPDPEELEQAFATFRSLAAEAPPEIESDWATIDTAVGTVEDTLAEAGLEISDLAALQQGQLPEGVEAADLQKVATELQSLGGQEFADAGDAIEKHAQDECDIDLSPSSAASPTDEASPSDDASN